MCTKLFLKTINPPFIIFKYLTYKKAIDVPIIEHKRNRKHGFFCAIAPLKCDYFPPAPILGLYLRPQFSILNGLAEMRELIMYN